MANRAYLYSTNSIRKSWDEEIPGEKITGLSEWSYKIPLVYKILVSQESQFIRSYIWDNEVPLAIIGNLEKGKRKLESFLYRLKDEGYVGEESLRISINETNNVFDSRALTYALLEAGEIFDMNGDVDVLARQLYEEQISNIDEVIENTIFEIKYLYKDENQKGKSDEEIWYSIESHIGLGDWSRILYFDLSEEQYPQ